MREQLNEFRNHRYFRVGAFYVVAAWVAIQVATSTFPYLGLPDWLIRAVILLALVGFPIVLILAWLQERRARADGSSKGWLTPAIALVMTLALVGVWVWRMKTGYAGAKAAPTFAAATLSQLTSSPEVEEFPAFSPDGQRIAFVREVDGFTQLFTRDLAGQETQITTENVDHSQPAWSPDGRALLYVQATTIARNLELSDVFGRYSGGDVWRLDIKTKRAQKIITDAYNPSYSHDGKRIAFDASYVGPRRIWIADEMGRNPRQVTTDASEAVAHILPRWSPDDELLVFQYTEKTKLDIRAVSVATGHISNITDDAVRDADPVWLAGGREVVFSSPRGGGWNLWRVTVGADGAPSGAPRQITTGAGQDLQAAPSADGRKIAFVTLNQNSDVWMLPVDPASGAARGEPEALIATTREDSRAAWSPDGKTIAFNSDRAGDMNLFLYSIADRSTRQITHGAGGDFQPSWSPDGQRIAFFSSRTGSADIWSLDVATGALQQLTKDAALDVNPVFSPDGKYIAFQSDRGGRKEVWLMNGDGSGQKQLTTTGVSDHFMEWSADGATVMYHLTGPQVMQVSVATGEARLLGEIKGGAHVSFSPDRKRVMDVVDHKTLWVTALDGSAPMQVFAFPDAEVRIDYPRWSPDGRYVVFDRLKPTGGDIWMLEVAK